MFGNKKKLVEQLSAEGGKVAWATVLQSTDQWRSSMSSSMQAMASMTDHVKVKLRVQPEGEPPFEAEFHQAFPGNWPMQGWQCEVIYDPNDHSRIAVLENRIFPPGIDHDSAERAGAMRDQAMAALRSGQMAEYIEDMKAKALRGELPGTVVVGGNVVSGGGAHKPDVIDRLTKLADLRDRGVLTEAEFEAQKAKILGSS
jgi:Short C-terminal domain